MTELSAVQKTLHFLSWLPLFCSFYICICLQAGYTGLQDKNGGMNLEEISLQEGDKKNI
jgi:hypothetical protein